MTFKHLLKKKRWLRLALVLAVVVYILFVISIAISYSPAIYQSKRVYEGDPLFGSINTPIKIEASFDYSTIEGYESFEEKQKKYGIYADLMPIGEYIPVSEALARGARAVSINYKDYSFVDWLQVGRFLTFFVGFTLIYYFILFAVWRISLYIIYGEKLINRIKKK